MGNPVRSATELPTLAAFVKQPMQAWLFSSLLTEIKGFPKYQKQQVMGIEPTYPAWKAGVLPLNHTCINKIKIYWRNAIGVTGFEPATSWSQTRRSSQTEPHPGGFQSFITATNHIIHNIHMRVNTFAKFF